MRAKSDEVDLTGQVALVTGGGRGLGRAFAVELAKAGASVGITARTQSQLDETVKLVEASGGQAIAISADVTDKVAIEKVVASLEERFGPVDILVNNAGLVTPLGNDWELDADEWWQTFNINVNGPYICTRAVIPGMMARRKGRIINITSIGAHTVHRYATAYCASKAAISHFTNCLAPALKEHGIGVFALAPAGPTTMHELLANEPNRSPEMRELSRRLLEEGQPMMDSSVRLLMYLVSGNGDSLSGRHISWDDSEDELTSRVDEIERDDLYVLRLRK